MIVEFIEDPDDVDETPPPPRVSIGDLLRFFELPRPRFSKRKHLANSAPVSKPSSRDCGGDASQRGRVAGGRGAAHQ